MEKDRGFRIIAVIALVLAVVGLAVGFAAFSATFTIEEETVTVNPSSNLLQDNMKYVENSAAVSGVTGGVAAEGANAGTANDSTWSGITVNFTDKGTATFTATVENKSNYVAYLNTIKSIATPDASEAKIACVAATGTNADSVETTCGDIQVTVEVTDGTHSLNDTITNIKTANASATTLTTGEDVAAAVNGTNTVTVTVSYTGETILPDGGFTVHIPTIQFDYSTSAVAAA